MWFENKIGRFFEELRFFATTAGFWGHDYGAAPAGAGTSASCTPDAPSIGSVSRKLGAVFMAAGDDRSTASFSPHRIMRRVAPTPALLGQHPRLVNSPRVHRASGTAFLMLSAGVVSSPCPHRSWNNSVSGRSCGPARRQGAPPCWTAAVAGQRQTCCRTWGAELDRWQESDKIATYSTSTAPARRAVD